MAKSKLLTEKEVRNVILKFCELNASRAPIADFVPIIDIENFELKLLGTDVAFHGIAGFADHQMGKLIFFDQRFIIKSMTIKIKPDHAIVKTSLIWEARHWVPPAANSELLKAHVHQTWTVIRSPQTQQPIITSHIADKFNYLKGYAPGKKLKKDFHLQYGK